MVKRGKSVIRMAMAVEVKMAMGALALAVAKHPLFEQLATGHANFRSKSKAAWPIQSSDFQSQKRAQTINY